MNERVKRVLVGLWRNIGLAVVLAIGVGLGLLLYWGFSPARGGGPAAGPPHPHDAQSQPDATVWTCSMHPEVRLPKPGLCPKCRMPLIPLRPRPEAGERGLRTFVAGEEAKALMAIETAAVERMFPTAEVRMVGKVDYDETKLASITAWVPGRIDRLFVNYTGIPVQKGDHMVELYSPDLISAQEELLQTIESAKDLKGPGADLVRKSTLATIAAARDRLRLWGLSAEQVAKVEKEGKPSDHLTIYAPASGIVIHRSAQVGMYVQTGMEIYTIADLSKVWVKLDAYESDLSWIRYGQKVEFTTVSYPGETFTGTISLIDPVLNAVTRTVKVRVNVPNPAGKLKPEMFVKAVVRSRIAAGGRVLDPDLAGKWVSPMHPEIVKDHPGTCDVCGMPLVKAESLGYVAAEPTDADKPLVIPVTAALITGTRAVVYVAKTEDGKSFYEGREIVLGPRAGEYYLVRNGLTEGERVVTRGNFKIDSALQIEAKPSMMSPEGGGTMTHQHGGPQVAKPGQPSSAMPLPAPFKQQLLDVLTAAGKVAQTPPGEPLGPVHGAFADLEKALIAVDANLVEGHAAMLWSEMAMRLGNDVVEGKSVQTAPQADRVVQSLTGNAAALREKFGLIPAKALDPGFRRQLDGVFDAYFALQRALADDKGDNAAAATVLQTLNKVDAALLPTDDRQRWAGHVAAIGKVLSAASKDQFVPRGLPRANALDALREAFSPLSDEMASLARHFGPSAPRTVYVLRCPMALNNREAIWLQDDPKVRNPYFGRAMPQCGDVLETIGGRAEANRNPQ